MRPRSQILGHSRVRRPHTLWAGATACDIATHTGTVLVVFCADEDGWEHASVSPAGDKHEDVQPCPTWAQMHEVKRILWDDSETVVQLHPAEGEYFHGPGFDTNILHLWRPCDGDWSRIEEEGMEHGK